MEGEAEAHCWPEALLERMHAQGASVHVGSDALDDRQAARTIFFSPRHGGLWEVESQPCGDYEFSLDRFWTRGISRLLICAKLPRRSVCVAHKHDGYPAKASTKAAPHIVDGLLSGTEIICCVAYCDVVLTLSRALEFAMSCSGALTYLLFG